MRRSRPLLLFLALAAFAAGCAHAPLARRPDFRGKPMDAGDQLSAYYSWRLSAHPFSAEVHGETLSQPRLPDFFDAQGDSVAARWARWGCHFSRAGGALALGLELAAILVARQAPPGDPAQGLGWAAILPAGILFYSFHWMGNAYFRQPAAAHYNRILKEELGMRSPLSD